MVRSASPLASLEGRFLDRPLTLTADPTTAGTRWLGWTMIDLDQQPHLAALDLRGTTRDGAEPLSVSANARVIQT